eukprot:908846-Rhodomonas_salina.2
MPGAVSRRWAVIVSSFELSSALSLRSMSNCICTNHSTSSAPVAAGAGAEDGNAGCALFIVWLAS